MELAYPNPPLTDGVVTLRPWRMPDDYATLENASTDIRITATTTLPAEVTEAEAAEWVHRQHAYVEAGEAITMAIATEHADQAIGLVGLYGLERGWGMGNLTYWSAPALRGQGGAQRGVKLLVDWAFSVLDLTRVEARIVPDNLASIRVAEAAGLLREGFHPARYRRGDTWLDVLTYGAVNPFRKVRRTTWTEFDIKQRQEIFGG